MSEYVTNAAWLRPAGRVDAVDDVADQFERRAPAVPAAPKRAAVEQQVAARWPRSTRGWRSMDRLHPRAERLAPN